MNNLYCRAGVVGPQIIPLIAQRLVSYWGVCYVTFTLHSAFWYTSNITSWKYEKLLCAVNDFEDALSRMHSLFRLSNEIFKIGA